MVDAYLNVAERVLLERRQPLRPRDILREAYTRRLLPWQLHGARQDKTLHARLSEDIARNREESRFYRTGPGIFFLRSLRFDVDLPKQYSNEHLAIPRRKELKRDWVLALNCPINDILRPDGTSISIGRIAEKLGSGHYGYFPYAALMTDERLVAINSFVIVHQGSCVLSFRTGKFFPTTDPIYGSRSIGLGGAVFSTDVDMLFDSFFGIVANGIGELGIGIGLPRRLAERARYNNEVKPWLGVVVPKSLQHPSVIHVVMGYKCPEEFVPTKAAMSVNDLRWVDATNPGNSLEDYDKTSQILFAGDHVRDIIRAENSK